MPAYLLFIREEKIRDQTEMDTYSRKNREAPRDAKLKPLIIYGKTEALEGAAPDGIVLLEFPTIADARAWYERPEYQEAMQHRLRGADYRAMLIEGL
jgi:uncharacterized protein (DUF1330 family)